jgi:hypothetical protein
VDSMLSLLLTSSVPLKSTLSNSKAPSKYKLRPTTYGYHPQSWIATSNISACTTCYTTANTLRYCSCRSSCSFDAVSIFVCNDISSGVCNSVLKSSVTTINCALNNSMPLAISQDQQSAALSSPSPTQLSVTSPMLSSAASASQQLDGSFYSGQESPALSEVVSADKPSLSPLQENVHRKGLLICLIMNSFQCVNRFRDVSFGLRSDSQCSCMDYILFLTNS